MTESRPKVTEICSLTWVVFVQNRSWHGRVYFLIDWTLWTSRNIKTSPFHVFYNASLISVDSLHDICWQKVTWSQLMLKRCLLIIRSLMPTGCSPLKCQCPFCLQLGVQDCILQPCTNWQGFKWTFFSETSTHTHPFNCVLSGTTRVSRYQKGKPIWIYWSKIQWVAVASAGPYACAHRSRQITTPAPHHSVFCRPDALSAAQPTVSKHWRLTTLILKKILFYRCINIFVANALVYICDVCLQWHCWLGVRKSIRPVKNWVVGCWRG